MSASLLVRADQRRAFVGFIGANADALWAARALPPFVNDVCAAPPYRALLSGPPRYSRGVLACSRGVLGYSRGVLRFPPGWSATAAAGDAGLSCTDARTHVSALALFAAHGA